MLRLLQKSRWVGLIVTSLLFSSVPILEAHHVTAHSSSQTDFFHPFSSISQPPRSNSGLTFVYDNLDENAGDVYTLQLSGEYAITHRISVGGRIPFKSVRENSIVSSNSVGDVALGVKGLLWKDSKNLWSIFTGSEVSFPTGDEAKGLGSDQVLFSPLVSASRGFEWMKLITSFGTSVAAGNNPSPALDYTTGVSVPVFKGKIPTDLFLAFQGSTLFQSPAFKSGSTKGYITSGIVLTMSDSLRTTFGGRVSVVDSLQVKDDIEVEESPTIPLVDVLAGFMFNIDYSF